MDQGRQAGGEDDPPLLPSVPLEPSAVGAEPAGLQPWESVAVAGVAQANRELVADKSAATAGEDRRTVGEACAILLAFSGGRTPEPAAVRGDAGPDHAATGAGGIAISGDTGAAGRPFGHFGSKSSQQRRNGRFGCTMFVLFQIKKEIPV